MTPDDIGLPSSFTNTVRLFPLPNVVFFPQVLLPLHIFEPRYRQMTADSLRDDRLIGMVLIQPGSETEHLGKPPLSQVACVGRILAEQKLAEGKYNLLLRGLERVRIVQEIDQTKQYRTAHVHVLQEHGQPEAHEETMLVDLMKRGVSRWLEQMGVEPKHKEKLFEHPYSPNRLCDLLAFVLPLPMPFKQSLLEELDIRDRIRLLLGFLEAHVPESSELRKFPPDFSVN